MTAVSPAFVFDAIDYPGALRVVSPKPRSGGLFYGAICLVALFCTLARPAADANTAETFNVLAILIVLHVVIPGLVYLARRR